jgi:hypothetical protein
VICMTNFTSTSRPSIIASNRNGSFRFSITTPLRLKP